jgi:hypothetical protein
LFAWPLLHVRPRRVIGPPIRARAPAATSVTLNRQTGFALTREKPVRRSGALRGLCVGKLA